MLSTHTRAHHHHQRWRPSMLVSIRSRPPADRETRAAVMGGPSRERRWRALNAWAGVRRGASRGAPPRTCPGMYSAHARPVTEQHSPEVCVRRGGTWPCPANQQHTAYPGKIWGRRAQAASPRAVPRLLGVHDAPRAATTLSDLVELCICAEMLLCVRRERLRLG